jgi:hypothetical protein
MIVAEMFLKFNNVFSPKNKFSDGDENDFSSEDDND